MKERAINGIEGAAIIITALLLTVSFTGCISNENIQTNHRTVENVSLYIYGPNWTVSYENVTTDNTTVYALLLECAKHYNFAVAATYWGSMDSVFVDSINGTEGKDGKYWRYYVNGVLCNVGSDKYLLNSTDVVEWRYESWS